MANRPREILLVEDNVVDQELAKEAFRDLGRDVTLTIASDGTEAMRILHDRCTSGSRVLPDLVLLDVNLPGMSGLEVLKRLRAEPAFAMLPVLMLTTSSHLTDVKEAYRLHANCYLVKPFDYDDFSRLIQQVDKFWLGQAVLPPPQCPIPATSAGH